MSLSASELILNPDQSIYHLNLFPEDLASTVITVGDPDRVSDVSAYFDTIELKKGKREFLTHTGTLSGKRITVISTGIGTDNVDIVLNELDALANIDLRTRSVKEKKTCLDIVRIGTSGALQADIPIDSFLLSEYAMGLDGLLHFYKSEHVQDLAFRDAFMKHAKWPIEKSIPYVVQCDKNLAKKLNKNRIRYGVTVTGTGFYGPQGRNLRLTAQDDGFISKLTSFTHANRQLTNLEMETSGIYGLAKLLGHRAVSLNAILANRKTGTFSKQPKKTVDKLIRLTLDHIVASQIA